MVRWTPGINGIYTLCPSPTLFRSMKRTPETMGERVNASVASATGELHNLVNSTRSDMSEAARELRGLIGTTRARWQQDRWLFWIGLGGVVLGILLYALL